MSRPTTQRNRARISRRAAMRTLVVGAAGLAAACAGPAAAPTSVPTKAPAPPTSAPTKPEVTPTTAAAKPQAAPTTAAAAPTAAPKPTQAPAKAQIVKISLAQSSPGLVFAPVYVANEMKFFEQESIDLDWQQLQGNALVASAIVSGEIQFGANGAENLLGAPEKGLDLFTVAAITTSETQDIVVRKEFLQQKGVRLDSPLRDKAAALKNAKVGIASVAGTPTLLAKYLLKSAGLDPEKDVEFIVAGQGPARIAALRQGQIEAFVGGVPDPQVAEQEGVGVPFIIFAEESPVFKTFLTAALTGKKEWIEKNPGVTERVCRAIARANNTILGDLPAAKAALAKAVQGINPQVLDRGMDQLKNAYGVDGRLNEAMWKNAADVFLFAGAIKQIPPLTEGGLWTNRYLVNVPKR